MRIMARGIGCACVCLTFVASPGLQRDAGGQSPVNSPATLGGWVLRDSSRAPLGDAHVSLLKGDGTPLGRSVRTNPSGEFLFRSLATGDYRIAIDRVGYRPLADTVTVRPGAAVVREWVLSSVPQPLDPVKVVGEAQTYISPGLRGFEGRMRNHAGGYFIPESTFRKFDSSQLASLFAARLPGALQIHHGSHVHIASQVGSSSTLRGMPGPGDPGPPTNACWVSVYLDGVRIYAPGLSGAAPDFATMPVSEYAAAEFYPHVSRTPQQFSDMGAFDCGVLVLWTRER